MSAAIATTLLAAAASVPLVFAGRRLSGTTLTGPLVWTWAALWSIVLGQWLAARLHPASPIEFAAAMVAFCPAMSLMGAKRPQDRAWHLIVLSLWVVLALPAAEIFFAGRGQPLEIHDARGWFVWALIAVGNANLLLTRFWLAAVLVAAGQIALLGRYLPLLRWPGRDVPGGDWSGGDWSAAIGLLFFAAAIMWAAWLARRPVTAASPLDRVWLDFRNAFGCLWGLRVMERVNDAARTNGWPLELTWFGFRLADHPRRLPPAVERAVWQVLKNLLRRFVSDRWIERRTAAADGCEPAGKEIR